MDMTKAKSPRRSQEEDDAAEEEKKKNHWRRSLRRSELVVIGIFISLPVIVLLVGGRWGGNTVAAPGTSQSDGALPKGIQYVVHLTPL
jgi:hypothetical protein